ncbi:ATP-binding cassette domain-containing protein [Microlunatus parietis]|uniref:ABC-type multidrug transport system fused ATPase/permease subunit n=1 Tax=Microlunatus parietis TaxID=682979 RepID=A0A7Y9I454_9ACTN|nr:ABC transporter ATP-binding protein [Microlunatus parietis]NYE69655.1 ABC-type multidrug transport system fused ATPase/permease subunit [Microlunatus parietis]
MFDLLRYGFRVARGPTAALATLSLLMAVSAVLLAWLIGRVVTAGEAAAAGAGTSQLALLVTAAVLLLLARSVLPVGRELAATRLELGLDRDLAGRALGPMLAPVGIEHLEDPAVRDRYARSREVDLIGLSRGPGLVLSLWSSRLTVIGSALLVGAGLTWWLAPMLLGSVFFVEWWSTRAGRSETAAWAGRTEGQRRASYLYHLALAEGIQELRIFGLAGWIADRHTAERDAALRPVQSRRLRSALARLGVMAVHAAVTVVAIMLVVRALWIGEVSLGGATSVLSAVLLLATGGDPGTLVQARRAEASYRSLRSLPDLVSSKAPDRPERSVELASAPTRSIRFENVSFRYPGRDQDTLSGVTLELRAGESYALVGINGAGKSTLVKLLAGCYRPTTGRITVDGIDLAMIDSVSLAGWQRRIAALVQDFVRLPLSVTDNVAVGAGSAEQRADVAESARRAGLVPVVDRLPAQWDTILDRTVPGGAELSGGQWQRLALARALHSVDTGAGLLVLDEPAAALDVRAEAELVQDYLRLCRGVTSLIISHRFSVVRGAQRISVLHEGRIVESGSHAELITADGRYAAMFRLQAERYAAAGEEESDA